jgi:hypothetical protein
MRSRPCEHFHGAKHYVSTEFEAPYDAQLIHFARQISVKRMNIVGG